MVSIIKVVFTYCNFKTVYIVTMQGPDSKQRLADFGQPWVKIINNNNNIYLATGHLASNYTVTTWAATRYPITHSHCVGIKVTQIHGFVTFH